MQRSNFLGINNWIRVPNWLRRASSSVFSHLGLCRPSNEIVSRPTLMGATPQIHDDILYDYVMRRQQMAARRFQIPTNGVGIFLNFFSSKKYLLIITNLQN